MRQLHKVQKINESGKTVPVISMTTECSHLVLDADVLHVYRISFLGQCKSNCTKAQIELVLLIKFPVKIGQGIQKTAW